MRIFFFVLLMMFMLSRPTFAAPSIEITDDRASTAYWLKSYGDKVLV
ncbi:MAG: hypothetical protein IJU71_10905 [Selenomonadaceae bacterium]|nr:hypothetical protein [Selenomonadaceae bacterium]